MQFIQGPGIPFRRIAVFPETRRVLIHWRQACGKPRASRISRREDRSFTSVAGTEEVSRVDEVFGNASTRDEPGLVPVNEKRDELLNVIG